MIGPLVLFVASALVEEWSWLETREKAIRLFGGELPKGETEQEVIDAFTDRPVLVDRLIREVAEAKKAGRARSGWAVLRSRLNAIASGLDIVVTDRNERGLALRQAEQWVRNAGLYFDREDEFEDELFGDGGMLRAFRTDDELRTHLIDLWRSERPRGKQAEDDAEERAAAWVEGRKRTAELMAAKRKELEKAATEAAT